MRLTIVFLTFSPLALAAVSAPPKATASRISGTVVYRGKPVREAVVYLEGDKKGSPLRNVVIDQRGKRFIPRVTAVTPGTQIEFPNNDSVFHNVYAAFEASTFDLGEYPRGAVKRKRFDKCGVVALLCNIHSEMGAYIVVVDTPYFAVTDSRGRFSFPSVESGSYSLKAWHESGGVLSQSLKVEGELLLDLDLRRK